MIAKDYRKGRQVAGEWTLLQVVGALAFTVLASALGGGWGWVVNQRVRAGRFRRPEDATIHGPLRAWRGLPMTGGVGAGLPAAAWAVNDPDLTHPFLSLALMAAAASAVAAGLLLIAIDVDVHRLPDRVTGPGTGWLLFWLVVAAALGAHGEPLLRSLLAAASAGGAFLALALLGGGRGLGLGDVKLAPAVGLATGWLGWPQVALALWFGFALAAVAGIIAVGSGRMGWRDGLPFGPAMLAGAWITWVATLFY